MLFELREWWGKHKISFTAMSVAVVPSLFVSTAFPDAFSAATDIAVSIGRDWYENNPTVETKSTEQTYLFQNLLYDFGCFDFTML